VNGARRALIIANTKYKNLPVPPVDNGGAEELEEVLSDADFDVRVRQDLDQASITKVLDEFASSVQPGDIVLLYYSGYLKNERSTTPPMTLPASWIVWRRTSRI
jgi:uncharacterized caspase-like protein